MLYLSSCSSLAVRTFFDTTTALCKPQITASDSAWPGHAWVHMPGKCIQLPSIRLQAPVSIEWCSYLFCGELVKLKRVRTGFICSFLCNCCLESAFQPETSRKIAMYCLCLSVFLCVSLCSWLSQPIALFQAYLTKKVGSLVDAEYLKIVWSWVAGESKRVWQMPPSKLQYAVVFPRSQKKK